MQFERLLNDLDFLFIENVGNLVCPSSMKYTTIFNSADVAIVTKMDLAAAVEFDRHSAYSNVQAVRLACRYSSSLRQNRRRNGSIFTFSDGLP